MAERKCLVVYYSRSGNTKKVAGAVAEGLGADVEEIIDRKKRSGPVGFIIGAVHAKLKKLTEIEACRSDPASYDLIVIGTPVWCGTMSCAVRTYISRLRDRLPEVAFFLTTGSSGTRGTFKDMAELSGKEPVACLGLKQKQVRKGDWQEQVADFVRRTGL